MAQINNSQLSKELIDGAKIQTSYDSIPSQLADKVVPVMEVNPKLLRRVKIIKSISGSAATIYTTPTDRDFFMTACTLSVNKLATDTGTDAIIRATVDGVLSNFIIISGITLTADLETVSISFPTPIQIDRGTAISTSGANISRISATIFGYTTEQG